MYCTCNLNALLTVCFNHEEGAKELNWGTHLVTIQEVSRPKSI